jgi:two-component system sensor histidine kinase DctS
MEGESSPLELRVLTLSVARVHPRWVRFEVVDHGPGIPAEVAARLFTPFFTTRAEGMGLGLSLCRTVIEQHGGALDFGPANPGSATAPGTAFRFTLPAPDPARPGSPPGADDPA